MENYIKVHIPALERAKTKTTEVVDKAYENNIITKEEHEAINVEDVDPAKFYSIFNVQNKHSPSHCNISNGAAHHFDFTVARYQK